VDDQVLGSSDALKEGVRDRGICNYTCRTRTAGLVIDTNVIDIPSHRPSSQHLPLSRRLAHGEEAIASEKATMCASSRFTARAMS